MAWIGCYHVRLTPQCEIYESDLYGAYVSVVVCCDSEAEFREAAAGALIDEHYELLDVADVRSLDTSWKGLELLDSDILREQIADGHRVALGSFHTYPRSGLDA